MHLSYRMKLFLSTSIIVIILLSGLTLFSNQYLIAEYTKVAKNEMAQSVNRISAELNAKLKDMDDNSKHVLYNEELKSMLEQSLHYPRDKNYFDSDLELTAKMNRIFLSFLGINTTPRRISIISGKRNIYSFSTLPESRSIIPFDLDTFPWMKELSPPNRYYLTLPPQPDWKNATASSPPVISFVRKLIRNTPSNDRLLGYVVITQPYSMVESIVETVPGRTAVQTRIWNSQGELVYPYSKSGSSSFVKSKDQLEFRIKTANYNWTVVQTISKDKLLSPVRNLQFITLGSGLLLLVVTLVILYAVTGYLTAPIKKMRKQLHSITFDSPDLTLQISADNNEIVWLGSAIEHTINRLKESMNLTIEARSRELHAQFHALQAQIDPHFLYNTLMGISALAQESNNDKVVNMCERLASMLRYAGSSRDPIVAMSKELQHVRNYLDMLEVRYENYLHVDWDVDERIQIVSLPKLTLQPIVENAFKHGFSDFKPPYRIWIKGSCTDRKWTLTICDNGTGFTDEALIRLTEQISNYRADGKEPYEERELSGGIALINVYARLYRIYGGSTVFEASNRPEGGAMFRLGGNFLETERSIPNDSSSLGGT